MPIVALRTDKLFGFPEIPTSWTVIISSSICNKSPAKIEVTPVSGTIVSYTISWSNSEEIFVFVIGDWIILSMVINAFVFVFVALILCEVPIPTEENSNTSGINCKAFSAVSANLIFELSTLTI